MAAEPTAAARFVALFRGDDASAKAAEQLLDAGWLLPGGGRMPVHAPIPWRDPPQGTSLASLHALDPIAALIGAHAATGEARYLTRALEITLDWIGAHQRGLDSAAAVWRDLPAGRRGHRIAYVLAASEARGVGAKVDRVRLRSAIGDHLVHLAENERMAASATWGLEQALGQISIATQLPAHTGAAAALEQGRQRLLALLSQRVGADGGAMEHGPGRVHELLVPTQQLIEARVITDVAVLSIAARAREGLGWMTTPAGTLATIGDTAPGLRLRGRAHPAADVVGVRAFPQSGWWVMRGAPPRPCYVAVCAGFHSTSHKHADDLALVWHAGADIVLADPGRYGRGPASEPDSELRKRGFHYADPGRVYVESTHAHSTVEIDGASDVRTPSRAYGSAVRRRAEARGLHAVELETRRGSVAHRRTVIVKPGEFVVVCDTLTGTSDSSHAYTCHWQLGARVGVVETTPHPVLGLASGRRVDLMCVVGGGGYRALRGEDAPRLAGWLSPRAGALEPAWSVALDAPGPARRHTFVTVLALGRHDAAPVEELCRTNASGRRVRAGWQAGGIVHQVDLVADGEALELRYRNPA